jgi:glycine hydroxymethyltransferase
MDAAEMKEIAAIIKRVLAGAKPEIIATGDNKGQASKAKYSIDPKVKDAARSRVAALLSRFPVYPELDLGLLEKYF